MHDQTAIKREMTSLPVAGTAAPKKRKLHDILQAMSELSPGQRRVAAALISRSPPPTYRQLAAELGVHVGTVHTQMGRIKRRRPDIYAVVMAVRSRQLAERHQVAVERAEAHSKAWHQKQANRRYFYRFGRWPWDR
jgi:FixJ family two-component response regulator